MDALGGDTLADPRGLGIKRIGDGWTRAPPSAMLRRNAIEPCAASDYMHGLHTPPREGFMLVTMMKAKLHRATVTQADLEYEGSISIDRNLLDASGILPHEQVDVLNINTGARFTTYAIEAPRGSRTIGVNGAAARLVQAGDKVIVVAYCQMDASEARNYAPQVVLMDEGNHVKSAA
jgi:aspartate 1-decarboxylase